MDSKAQVSIEYLMLLSIILTLTTIVAVLMGNLLQIKGEIQNKIIEYRNKTISMF